MSAPAHLDDQSRRTIGEFVAHLCIACALLGGASLLGLRPWRATGQLLATLLSLYSLVTFFRAARSGERPGGASLNLWDEAVAFNGCAFLLHALTRYPG